MRVQNSREKIGRNMFRTRWPATALNVLRKFLAFYSAVMEGGNGRASATKSVRTEKHVPLIQRLRLLKHAHPQPIRRKRIGITEFFLADWGLFFSTKTK